MESRFRGPGSPAGLRGRARECALLDELVSAIRRAESRSLVVRGEAGIGKTALLEYLIASASDMTVVRAVGVQSDMELAFASVHQLCAPLLERLERLPAPQRDALRIVFGLSAGPPPDRYLVGLAVLSLLSEAAEERPLLCVVDDAQWLDRASALTLAFVARRLLAEPVGIVFAAREPGEELQHVPELEVHGVRNSDARALLSSAVRFKLDERIRDRVIAETRGNPLLLWRAAERLGIGPDAAEAAEAEGLLAIGERVTFRHPLVRSAVYRPAAVQDRRAVHLALAEATDREADRDRRAWHLAAAAAGPDEQVALELERSAGRAQARGGVAAAAAFLQRACALTRDPARRAERALAAAQASLQAGAFDAALRLLATAEVGALDEFQRARVDLLRAHVGFISFRDSDAPTLLLKAARRLQPFDLELARDTYLTAWGAALVVSDDAREGGLLEICRAVRALPPPPGDPRPLDVLLDGLALLAIEGHAAAAPTLRRAAKALADMPVEEVLLWGWVAASASAVLWDIEGMSASAARKVRLLRDAGALAALPSSLSNLGIATAWMGDFAGAASLIAEIENVAAATGTRQAPFALLRLLALQGREAEAAAAIAGVIELTVPGGQGLAAAWAHWAAAVLYNGLGRYAAAASAARQAISDPLKWWSMWVLPELVEAATRTGDAELARDALERLTKTTQPAGTDFALGIEARCRALVSDGALANALYRVAIERLSRTALRPELARTRLLYGEWLRREKRRVDAREQLRTAHEMLVSIGMEAFAERARKELRALGEKVRKRTVETRDDLTAQERQIARLARDGLSNPEIGARLFLSPRTVEWHLRNVFSKLGIRSRRELASALASFNSHPVTA
jgi:DNA-binding CsgD family transcriptional regulator